MGVPKLFMWLSRKYPSVVVDCVEQTSIEKDGVKVPVDVTQPNPNNIEFDNLYLDMNGIIHPCTHPEDKPAPRNEDEMMVAIFEAIDRVFAIVRPRQLLYMAIDGVAPRAKMNQQRSRRFRAAKEMVEKKEETERIKQDLQARGLHVPPPKPKESHFDSNCITPGTPFMDRLAKCLHYYIHQRLTYHPGWRNIKVILSDASVPGEGEHKIMEYIRCQRASPSHDPNTQHVLCGADADLIMLGLATHEVNFTIIREEFVFKEKPCDICRRTGHEMAECAGITEAEAVSGDLEGDVYSPVRFIFIRLCVLREYLERELAMPNLPFEYDFDRVLDDWVLLLFFVGNDFLPHLPSLEIRERGIERLVDLYKSCCYHTGGYLTDSGRLNMHRVLAILKELGGAEDEIFRVRRKKDISFRNRRKQQKQQERVEKEAAEAYKDMAGEGALGVMAAGQTATANDARSAIFQQRMGQMQRNPAQKRSNAEEEDTEPPDEVRLHESGAKDRYYESKFEVPPENTGFRKLVSSEYAVGLAWVLRYYYQGCASWKWFYPYHYSPFASDFSADDDVTVSFDLGKPFAPFEQLMGVFPAASSKHVPQVWSPLMHDPESFIIDFYPDNFRIDLNGKQHAWMGVALLPFVDEGRLKSALKPVYPLLSEEEIHRNTRGDDLLYVARSHSSHAQLADLYRMGMEDDTEVPISGDEYQGLSGLVLLAKNNVAMNGALDSPVAGQDSVSNNLAICVRFRNPSFAKDFIFPARRLEGAKEPERVLKPEDFDSKQSYRPQIGFQRNGPKASLDASGHRSISHYSDRGGRDRGGGSGGPRGNYSNVAPPNLYRGGRPPNQNRNYGGGGGGGSSGGGNYGGSYQRGGGQSGNYRGNSYGQGGNYNRGGNSYNQGGNSNRGGSSYNQGGSSYGQGGNYGNQRGRQGFGYNQQQSGERGEEGGGQRGSNRGRGLMGSRPSYYNN